MWLQDPASDALLPFWLDGPLAAQMAPLQPLDPAPAGLPPDLRSALGMAGLLVPEDYVETRCRQWNSAIARYREQFHARGYAPVGGLIHPFHIAALRRYFRHMIRRGRMRFGDQQSARRYAAHNNNVARFFHRQLTKTVAAIAGEPVKPSYVYFASYQEGAILAKHTDRQQCEVSITFCLDYSPEPVRETPWPLVLHTSSGTVAVYQALGDGLLYRGRELPHSRGPLPAGHTSTSIFFHYVREDFDLPPD